MKHFLPLAFFLVLLRVISPNFPAQVAAVCRGEASWAIRDCACTISNRLDDGATEQNVLDAYYAFPTPASAVEVERVRALLILGCPQPYYFMYSIDDVYRLGIHNIPPLKVSPNPTSGTTIQVWFYEKEYRNRNGGN